MLSVGTNKRDVVIFAFVFSDHREIQKFENAMKKSKAKEQVIVDPSQDSSGGCGAFVWYATVLDSKHKEALILLEAQTIR